MRIVVLGGTGQVGRMVVDRLERRAQAVVVASPTNGVDARSGRGLDEALEFADAVIDTTNAPDLTGPAARAFFDETTHRLLEAEQRAGVAHHVVLSIVGADHAAGDGYFAAKAEQERIVESGPVAHSILRATQFFDFARTIAKWNTADDTVRLPARPVQPVAASDVADALVESALSSPSGATVDMAGPERMLLPEFVRRVLRTDHDPRYVVTDDAVEPKGFNVASELLLPREPMRLAPTSLDDWVHTEGRRRLAIAR